MNQVLKDISLWIHLLCMLGAFGALVSHAFGLSADQKNDADLGRRTNSIATKLVAIGLLAGLSAYFFKIKLSIDTGIDLPSSTHMTVGIKFVILLGVGACLGISSGMIRKERLSSAAAQRGLAMALLAVAALLGVWL